MPSRYQRWSKYLDGIQARLNVAEEAAYPDMDPDGAVRFCVVIHVNSDHLAEMSADRLQALFEGIEAVRRALRSKP